MSLDEPIPAPPQKPLARLILTTFVLTFMGSRGMVILIMARILPDFYLHIGHGQTHVHHLNYGIFLLSGVGAFLLLRRPTGKALSASAIAYGIGLALTFDEFGMWLHLGGSYWQRPSFDAVVTITALLGLIAAAPRIRRFKTRHWIITALVAGGALVFGFLVMETAFHLKLPRISSYLHSLETSGPE